MRKINYIPNLSLNPALPFCELDIFIMINLFIFILRSELDQSNVTDENPEVEEHPPADSENK